MKVKIDKYTNYVNAYCVADFLLGWTKNDSLVDKLEDVLKVFEPLWNKYEYDNQKVEVNIDPWDTWSLDVTLAHVICPALESFKDRSIGIKNIDNEDLPEDLQVAPDEYGATMNGPGWDWILDEMIFAFDYKRKGEEFEVAENKEAKAEIYKRVSNGFRLFGKYYSYLWT